MSNHIYVIATRVNDDGWCRTFWARLVTRPEDWRWLSAAAHMSGRGDRFVDIAPALELVAISLPSGQPSGRWASYALSRVVESVARLVGSRAWLAGLEMSTGLTLAPRKGGSVPEGGA